MLLNQNNTEIDFCLNCLLKTEDCTDSVTGEEATQSHILDDTF